MRSAGQTQGERRSPKRGQSVEFADFRPYVAGDDFRRIDWNAYARLERFFIKLFVEEEDLTVHLLIDTSRSMHWGEPEQAGVRHPRRRGAGLYRPGRAGPGHRDRRSAVPAANGAGYFPPHRGKRQALALFDFLQVADRSTRCINQPWPCVRPRPGAARLCEHARARGQPSPARWCCSRT